MPIRVLIIGLLFCAAGLHEIWEMLTDLMRSHINFNFGVLLLPVGIGLLRGRAKSQWWAKFWIILGYIGSILLLVVALFSPESARVDWPGKTLVGIDAVPYILGMSTAMALLLGIIHKLLDSEKATEYFNRNNENSEQDSPSPSGTD